MSDPLVKTVTDDDGVERYVAADGPSDPEATPLAERTTEEAQTGSAVEADPDDPNADQPGRIVEKGAPDAAAADAADGDGADTRPRKRKS